MTAEIYLNADVAALKMLTKYGQDVTLTKLSNGSYNPATGTMTTSSSSQTVKGAVFNHRSRDVDGTLILQGDKRLLLDSSAIFNVNDNVTINSVVYVIAAKSELKPADKTLLFICNIRAVS